MSDKFAALFRQSLRYGATPSHQLTPCPSRRKKQSQNPHGNLTQPRARKATVWHQRPKICTGNFPCCIHWGSSPKCDISASQPGGRGNAKGVCHRPLQVHPCLLHPALCPRRLTDRLPCLRCSVGFSWGSSQRREGGWEMTEWGYLFWHGPRVTGLQCASPAAALCRSRPTLSPSPR